MPDGYKGRVSYLYAFHFPLVKFQALALPAIYHCGGGNTIISFITKVVTAEEMPAFQNATNTSSKQRYTLIHGAMTGERPDF